MSEPQEELPEFLKPGRFVDSDHPDVIAFAQRATEGAASEKEKAVRLYLAVRDGIRYDPYGAELTEDGLKASAALRHGRAFCVPKAALLAAAARAVGIAARLGFADVRNHLTTKRLKEQMGTDTFVYHGYTELYLGGRWVKATPTFNIELCEKFGVEPLDFDGERDALMHPFNRAGDRHMEYVRERGSFADIPLEQMLAAWKEVYPHWQRAGEDPAPAAGDFEKEAEAEAR